MVKTIKCQVKPFKEVWNGWNEVLSILHHFIYYYIHVHIYIYIYIYIYFYLFMYRARERARRPGLVRLFVVLALAAACVALAWRPRGYHIM